ncbi:hypothetical protein BJ982_000963 [Sphaerisporangium siamense]|uniref:Uncharacterized protein n=2 Tax=Sphaerisporangium siamense TaxID=795645 RepID=A0A7W7D326_9ACTN|nr:hypothetical protein [Sphaerisporangium siamense]MBB4699419.1 hypothetical protein [Sphaerisporangium siamense]
MIARYKSLMTELAWLGTSMGWTVVTPRDGSLSTEDVVARLGLGDAPDVYTSEPGISGEISFGLVRTSTMLFEANDISYTGRPEISRSLSEGAEVWHVSWNITGQSKLRVALEGEIVVEVPDLDPENAWGTHVNEIGADMDLLRQAARRRWPARRATAMAILEARTGAHLDKEWLDTPRSTVAAE